MLAKQGKYTLKVFEAFAGIGAQATALERLGIDYEVVGISDWFVDAIICYDALHNNGQIIEIPDRKKQIEELNHYTFSRDSVHPIQSVERLDTETLEKLYVAHKRSKNKGSILDLHGHDIPDTDLFVYSFPCQDLSTGGNSLGMKKGSGTRSSMLWAIENILTELHLENRLPKYLLLENVKTILADSNKPDLTQWLDFLASLGYNNEKCMILNALDFGVPQDRERAFIFSHLGDKSLNVEKYIRKQERRFNIYDFVRLNYDDRIIRMEADRAQLNRTPSREVMWRINGKEINENLTVRTITCNMDRTHTSALFLYEGAKGNTYRRLTIREAFLFMGFTEAEYERTLALDFRYRRMNKLIGNSIIVNVLQEIFRAILEAEEKAFSQHKEANL